MLHLKENFINDKEALTRRYPAEELYWRLPEIDTEYNVPRVTVSHLNAGEKARLQMSQEDRLASEGWDPQSINKKKIGQTILNSTGDAYRIVGQEKNKLKIEEITHDSDHAPMAGEIVAEPTIIFAQKYKYKMTGKNNGLSNKFNVYDAFYRDQSLRTSEFIDELVRSIPAQCMDLFDEIQIHRMKIANFGKAKTEPTMFTKKRILFIYVHPDEDYPIKRAKETMYHELGHMIAKELKGSAYPGKNWKRCMEADGGPATEYAAEKRYAHLPEDNGEVEDFADEFMMYVAKDAAKDNAAEALRNLRPNCFQKLDEVMAELLKRQRGSSIDKLKRKVLKPAHPLAA